MKDVKAPKKKLDFSSYFIVVAFLVLEVIAFLSFSLGYSYLLYGILGLVVLALLFLVTFKEINFDGFSRSLYFAFPLLIFGLLTAIGTLNKYFVYVGGISQVTSVFVPISLVAFSLIGYLTSLNKQFKISTAFIVIYSALSIYVFINFISTIFQFGAFYPFIYPDSKFYYAGTVSPKISELAYGLIGFEITEIAQEYYAFFPTLLLTSVIGLFIINPKTNIKKFLLFVGYSLLAFISILLVCNKIVLISEVAVVLLIALIVIYLKVKKPLVGKIYKIGFITVLAIVCLLAIVVFFNAQTDWGFTSGLRNLISSNAISNRLFNTNRFIKPINGYLVNIFSKAKLFGFYQYNPEGVVVNTAIVTSSKVFLVDSLASSGVLGGIALLIFIIIGLVSVIRYIKKPDIPELERALLPTFIFVYFVFLCFNACYDITYFTTIKSSFYLESFFLIVVMLISYAFASTKKEAKKDETHEA